MKSLFLLVVPAILLAGLVLFGLGDTSISIAETSIHDGEITTSQIEVSNSSASATITITMTGMLDG